MKKNVMMRVASIMLVLVLLTSSGISGTFAKYVTADGSTDEARVAKWGVKITPNGTVFEQIYATHNTTLYTGPNSVESSDTWKVVAPGTSKTATEIVLEGTPEVAYEVKFVATVDLLNWEAFGAEYCPIIFTVESATYGMEYTTATNKYTTVADLAAAVKNAIDDCTAVYGPNQPLTAANFPNVSWEWPFETGTGAEIADFDSKDTYLGNVAAGTLAGSAATIDLDIAITVTQVD